MCALKLAQMQIHRLNIYGPDLGIKFTIFRKFWDFSLNKSYISVILEKNTDLGLRRLILAYKKVDFLQKWLNLFLSSTILGKFFEFLAKTDFSANMGSHNDVTKPIFSLVN